MRNRSREGWDALEARARGDDEDYKGCECLCLLGTLEDAGEEEEDEEDAELARAARAEGDASCTLADDDGQNRPGEVPRRRRRRRLAVGVSGRHRRLAPPERVPRRRGRGRRRRRESGILRKRLCRARCEAERDRRRAALRSHLSRRFRGYFFFSGAFAHRCARRGPKRSRQGALRAFLAGVRAGSRREPGSGEQEGEAAEGFVLEAGADAAFVNLKKSRGLGK